MLHKWRETQLQIKLNLESLFYYYWCFHQLESCNLSLIFFGISVAWCIVVVES